MNVLVVSGFLGSGKTTFLLSLLRSLALTATRTAIIENEAGQVAIDGAVLRAQGAATTTGAVPVRELYAGCICCTLRSDLTSAIESVRREHDPQLLLLEPSGVAGPDMVVEAVETVLRPGEGDRVTSIQIVDARRVAALRAAGGQVSPFLERSVQVCHRIIINKTDGLDPGQLDSVVEWVNGLGAEDVHQVDVRSPDAVRTFMEADRRSTGAAGTPGPLLHRETLASAARTFAIDQQAVATVVASLRRGFAGVARAVEECFPGTPGHIKGILSPPGIAFNVAGEGDPVTVTGGDLPVLPGEATLSVQLILAGESPDQDKLQTLLDRRMDGVPW